MVENKEPKLEFTSDYRDASADDEFDTEDIDRYPQAALPFLVPKAPRLAPQRSDSIPGLPSLDSELGSMVASAIASEVTAATALAELKQKKGRMSNAPNSPTRSVPQIASTTSYNPNRDPRRRPKLYPDLSEASTSFASREPSPVRTKNSPSLPSVTAENIAQLNRISQDAYRPSPPARDDEDADDELNTESDLETHADDDDFEYGAILEGNEGKDDEEYESLRVRLNDLHVRKRTFTEFEAAQPGDEEAKKAIGDTTPDGRDKEEDIEANMQAQKGEEEHSRREKKART